MDKEDYERLMATLERVEKANSLADIVRTAPEPSGKDRALIMPTIDGEDSFERIRRSCLTYTAFALQELEKAAGKVKYYSRYCENLYRDYKSRENEIKHPDILKFIKDYETYKGDEE